MSADNKTEAKRHYHIHPDGRLHWVLGTQEACSSDYCRPIHTSAAQEHDLRGPWYQGPLSETPTRRAYANDNAPLGAEYDNAPGALSNVLSGALSAESAELTKARDEVAYYFKESQYWRRRAAAAEIQNPADRLRDVCVINMEAGADRRIAHALYVLNLANDTSESARTLVGAATLLLRLAIDQQEDKRL